MLMIEISFKKLFKAKDVQLLDFQSSFIQDLHEARSQVGICESQWTTDFEDFGTHMSQSVEKYLDVVGTWLIVR